MIQSAKQLIKYKTILKKLNKTFPKGARYQAFTIDISYGGNKEHNIERLSLGGVASEQGMSDEFLKMILLNQT